MQSTDSPTPTETLEWWWPSPDSFSDLTVTDTDTGWDLSAPDGTELAEWLAHWSQSEEHHALFQAVLLQTLTDHANHVLNNLEQHGETQAVPDRCESHPEQTENECSGVLSKHEPGSDTESST